MEITAVGFILLPLCAMFCFSPDALLLLLQGSSVLGAAAAVVVSGSGMAPPLLPAALFSGYMALQVLLGANMAGARRIFPLLAPMILLGLYGLASAVIMPNVFNGRLEVWPEKPEPPYIPVVLHPGSANVTQSIYFLVNFTLFCAATFYLAPRPTALVRQMRLFLYGGYATCAICLWQLANNLTGLPFPEDFFYSNPGWSILAHEGLDGVPRISGPFTEPAALAFSLCGNVFACVWMLLKGHRDPLIVPLLPLSLLCALISTSSSAIVVLAVGIVICIFYPLVRGIPEQARPLLRYALPVSLVIVLGSATLLVTAPSVATAINTIFEETFNKGNSDSYEARTTADQDSLALLVPTYGLGAGVGSSRSSSLIPGLLAAMGVPGVLLPAWFILRLRQRLRQLPPHPAHAPAVMARDGFAAAIIGSLLVAFVSGPMIVAPIFFLELAALVAAVIQIEWGAQPSIPHFAKRSLPTFDGCRGAGLLLATFLLSTSSAKAAEPNFLGGVDTHFAQAPQTALQGLSLFHGQAITSLRDEMYWGRVETVPGYYAVPLHWIEFVQQAHELGIRPLLVLDYGNALYDKGDKPRSPQAVAAFARYAGTLAGKFRDQVAMYEVWNEWNNQLGHTTPGNMADYLPLLHASSVAIRAVNPKALVLADGILWSDGQAGVIEQAIRLGALHDADGIALHPYFYNRGSDHSPEAWANYLQTVENRMTAANAGKPVPLYITELGWPSSTTSFGVTSELQAAYAARVYLLARSMPFIAGLWWYDLRNDGANPSNDEQNFGLVLQNFSPKPAFTAVCDWLKHLSGAQYIGPMPTPTPEDKVAGLVFRVPGKGAFRAIWSTDDAAHIVEVSGKTVSISAMPVYIPGDGK